MSSLRSTSCQLALAAVLAGVMIPGFLHPAQAQDGEVIDEISAIVGDKIVLKSDVDGLVLGLLQRREMEYSDQLWMDALNQLIDQKVLAIHAQRDTTIQVTDQQVEQALDDRIEQLTQQVGNQARLEEIYGKSLVQIKADLRGEFRERLLAERLQSRKLQTIKITPTEVEQWFGQFPTDSLPTLPDIVRVSHIVRYPTIAAEAEQEALEIATTVRDSVVSGSQTLEEMARMVSDDPGSASRGGTYENYKLGDLVPEFAAVASRLEIGEISEPFKSPFGYHVLRVDRRVGDTVDFTHVLISIDESDFDPQPALDRLQAVRDSLLQFDIPFGIMARRHSEEEATAELGGRVFDPNTGERDLFLDALGPTWRSTLDTLEINEISQPAEVQLLDGKTAFHIVRLERRVPSHRVDIETDYARIEQLALQEKRQRVVQEWLDRLRKDVFIELRGKADEIATSLTNHTDGMVQRRN